MSAGGNEPFDGGGLFLEVRRSGASGARPEVIERQLAHKERNMVRRAYNHAEYLDERRQLMQWWSDYLDGCEAETRR